MQTGSPQTGIIKTLPPSTPWCEACTLSPVPILQPITSAGRKQHQKQGMRCRGSGEMHMVLLPFPHAGASSLHLQPHTCTTSPAISPVCCSKGTSAQRAPRCHSLPQCIQAGLFKSNSCRLLLCYSHSSFCKGVGLELAQPYSALPPTPYHDAGQSLPSHCLRSPTGITGN